MSPPKKEVLGFGASLTGATPTGAGDGEWDEEWSHCSRTLSFWSIFSLSAFSSGDSTCCDGLLTEGALLL